MRDGTSTLITACGSRTAGADIVFCVRQSHMPISRGQLCGTDLDRKQQRFSNVDRFYPQEPGLTEAARSFLSDHPSGLLIPLIEEDVRELRFAGLERRMLAAESLRGVDLLDKHKVDVAIRNAGVGAPKRLQLSEIFDRVPTECPLVLRPRTGRGGRGVRVVQLNDQIVDSTIPQLPSAALEDYLTRFPSVLVTEYVHGDEYCALCCAGMGELLRCEIIRKRRFDGGVTWSGEFMGASASGLLAEVLKVVESLRLTGIFNVQFLVSQRQFYFIEVNARFSGSMGIALAAGVNFVNDGMEVLQGNARRRALLSIRGDFERKTSPQLVTRDA